MKESFSRLRGDLAAELASPGSQVTDDDRNILTLREILEQYDRDTDTARKQIGEEKDDSFRLRVQMPGGILTTSQYLALDELANQYGAGTLRMTARQRL